MCSNTVICNVTVKQNLLKKRP